MLFFGSKNNVKATPILPYEGSSLDLQFYESDYNFEEFMIDHADTLRPAKEFLVDITHYDYQNGLFPDDIPEFNNYEDDLGNANLGIYIPETGDITFEVEVDMAGLYNISVFYYTILGRGASINKGIKINGEYQFLESERINFNRFWEDEFKVSERRIKGIDDLRPAQTEKHLWSSGLIEDNMGYYDIPYYFNFDVGVNTIH